MARMERLEPAAAREINRYARQRTDFNIIKPLCLDFLHNLQGESAMSKVQKSNKEDKKKPAHSPKEKKAIKQSKHDPKDAMSDLFTGK